MENAWVDENARIVRGREPHAHWVRHGQQMRRPQTPLTPRARWEGGWFVSEPLAHRLHQKSALGLRVDGGLLLTPEEVLFCHWYRHLPLPADGWFPASLKDDTALLRRTIALDVLRNGGERVVPVVHLASRYDNLPLATWAIRWERQEAWTAHPGHTQVRIQRTHDPLDWDELGRWVFGCSRLWARSRARQIDDEFDTTVYHLSFMEPKGATNMPVNSAMMCANKSSRGALRARRWTVVSFFLFAVNGPCLRWACLIFWSFRGPKSVITSSAIRHPEVTSIGHLSRPVFCFVPDSSTDAGGGRTKMTSKSLSRTVVDSTTG